MVWLGIGVKVATLPVIALGVGIGVDYALYVLTVILAKLKQGQDITTAYYETLNFTGRVVALIGDMTQVMTPAARVTPINATTLPVKLSVS